MGPGAVAAHPVVARPVPSEDLRFYTPAVSSDATTWLVATSQAKNRRATINDVARRAGVHKGTVSRALRGMEGVGAETRQRILVAAKELDYAASDLGTALATGSTGTIGIILPTLGSWYFNEVASGASAVLSAAGFRIELINLNVDSDCLRLGSRSFDQLFRQLAAGRSRDALLYAGTTSLEQYGHALVPISAQGGPVLTVPGVYVDHREGGRLAARHLLDLGHTSLAIVDGRMVQKVDASVWELRTAGFLEEVAAAGLDPVDVRIVRPGDCHTEEGELAGHALLDASAPLPGAVFCHSDELAFGLIATLRRAQVQCPRDISVIGFDDHPMSRLWDLTTITQHAEEQGVRAAYALLAVLGVNDPHQGASASAGTVDSGELRVELTIRGSTVPTQSAV